MFLGALAISSFCTVRFGNAQRQNTDKPHLVVLNSRRSRRHYYDSESDCSSVEERNSRKDKLRYRKAKRIDSGKNCNLSS